MTTDLRTVGHSKFDRILILTCGRWSFSVGSDAETTLRNATTSRSLLSLFFVITVFLQKKVWSETERKTNNVRGKSHRCSRTSLSHFFRRKRAKKNQNSCRPVSHGSTSTSLKYPSLLLLLSLLLLSFFTPQGSIKHSRIGLHVYIHTSVAVIS